MSHFNGQLHHQHFVFHIFCCQDPVIPHRGFALYVSFHDCILQILQARAAS